MSRVLYIAEGKRFELLVGCPTHAFQACALDRYANPPFSNEATIPKRPSLIYTRQFMKVRSVLMEPTAYHS